MCTVLSLRVIRSYILSYHVCHSVEVEELSFSSNEALLGSVEHVHCRGIYNQITL